MRPIEYAVDFAPTNIKTVKKQLITFIVAAEQDFVADDPISLYLHRLGNEGLAKYFSATTTIQSETKRTPLSKAAFAFEGAGWNQLRADISVVNHGDLAKSVTVMFPPGIDAYFTPSNTFGTNSKGRLVLESPSQRIQAQMPFRMQYQNKDDQIISAEYKLDFQSKPILSFRDSERTLIENVNVEFVEARLMMRQGTKTQVQLKVTTYITSQVNQQIIFPHHKCKAFIQFLTLSNAIKYFDRLQLRTSIEIENSDAHFVLNSSGRIAIFGLIEDFQWNIPSPEVPLKVAIFLVNTQEQLIIIDIRFNKRKTAFRGRRSVGCNSMRRAYVCLLGRINGIVVSVKSGYTWTIENIES